LRESAEENEMRNYLSILFVALFALVNFACTDPAANKPKATVGNAAPETTAPKTGGETLTISPDNSKIEFEASKVTRSHNGSFKQFSGTIDLISNMADQSAVKIDIDTASVVTDEDQLTGHLKTPDFFDVAKYPKATFVSTSIQPSTTPGATHTVAGNFDLHGVKRAIAFPATIQIAPDSVSVNAEFAINRKDWGLLYPGKADDLIRDMVTLRLTIKVPRKK
jgi:polyisoprenoid-binding protein YceI